MDASARDGGLYFPVTKVCCLFGEQNHTLTTNSQGTPFSAVHPCSCSKIPLDVCQGSTHVLLGIALINKGDKAGAQAVQNAASISHFIIPVRIPDIF